MCELLGLNFNQPVRLSLSFRGFRHRGTANPDGWGVVRFDGKAGQLFKEPSSAARSSLAVFLRDYQAFRSRIFIAHVRYASRGETSLANTHPFLRTFRSREIALAHNGTLDADRIRDSSRRAFRPVGETDSEVLFCALLTRLMSEPKIELTDFPQIEAVLGEFNRHGKMNLLFSDGEHLFCYRDQTGYNGLYLTERKAPYDTIALRDEDWEADLTEEKNPDQRGFVIATRALTRNETWIDLKPGSLTVFREGSCLYGQAA